MWLLGLKWLVRQNYWLSVLLILSHSLTASASEAEQILQALRAADQAASTQHSEQQQWLEEQQRWQAQLDMLTDQISAEKASAKELEQQLVELAAAEQVAEAQTHDPLAVELAALGTQLNGIFDQWSGHYFPSMPPTAESAEQFSDDSPRHGYQAIIQLQRTYQASLAAAQEWSTSIETGRLADNDLAVHVVRCGAVAAWWVDMTGSRAGTVEPSVSGLVLSEISDDHQRRAIIDAWRVVNGQRNPSVLLLPLAVAVKVNKNEKVKVKESQVQVQQ